MALTAVCANCKTEVVTSCDGGKTWTHPRTGTRWCFYSHGLAPHDAVATPLIPKS